ncbi:MAG: hypothetical protein IPL79_15490 [Myxococcales bacterium]|nr:hypothetical protein [Myxococcales bacterium]
MRPRAPTNLVALVMILLIGDVAARTPTIGASPLLPQPTYYRWEPLVREDAALLRGAATADTSWYWLPAATFVRLRTKVPIDKLVVTRAEEGPGGLVTQRLTLVPIEGGAGIWHTSGVGAHLGIAAPGYPGVAVAVERPIRRLPELATTQLRLALWAWLFRGQPPSRPLSDVDELHVYEGLATWAWQTSAQADVAAQRPVVAAAIWHFFSGRAAGAAYSSVEFERQELLSATTTLALEPTLPPEACHATSDGVVALRVRGPTWLHITARQARATWRPWLLRASTSDPATAASVLRAETSGSASAQVSAQLDDEADVNPLAVPSRALQLAFWLPAGESSLTLRASSAACFTATALVMRTAWFTRALRQVPVARVASHVLAASADATQLALGSISEAMAAGARLLPDDDPRRAAMWRALDVLLGETTDVAQHAVIGMAMLIVEQSATLETHEVERLLAVTASSSWAPLVKRAASKRLAEQAGVHQVLATLGDGGELASASGLPQEHVLWMALASALEAPADPQAREGMIAAWRNGRWYGVPEQEMPPMLAAPRVTVLSDPASPTSSSRSWFRLDPNRPQVLTAALDAAAPRRSQDDAAMLRWRVVFRTARATISLRIGEQAHELAAQGGVAVGEWLLPVGTHSVSWQGDPGDTAYGSLPIASDAAPVGITAQQFIRLRCDETWTLTAPSLPFLRVSATALGDVLPQVTIAPDRGASTELRFAPSRLTSVTPQGLSVARPMAATIALPTEARRLTLSCHGAQEAWLSVQARADAAAHLHDELAMQLAALRLPEPTPEALRTVTAQLREGRTALDLARRAFLWWVLGHGELAQFDGTSARGIATLAEQRDIYAMLAQMAVEPNVVYTPIEHRAWAASVRRLSLPAGLPPACAEPEFGGEHRRCMGEMLASHRREPSLPSALAAARAYVALARLEAATAEESLAMYALTSAALADGFHPSLVWARALSARGTMSRLVTAVDASDGSLSVAQLGEPPDLATPVGAKIVALDAPWDYRQGLIALDHAAGASLKLLGGRVVRVGYWCQPLVERRGEAPTCDVTRRLNQRPPEAFTVPPRVVHWQDVALPDGTNALAFDMLAPGRDRMLGIVVFDGKQPIVGETRQKAFRVSPQQPVVLRIAGPTVVTVERAQATGLGEPAAPTQPSTLAISLGETRQTLEASVASVEIPVLAEAEVTLQITAAAPANVLLRVRTATRSVRVAPFELPAARQDERVIMSLPRPVVPQAVPSPRPPLLPTLTTRLRAGLEREDDVDVASSASVIDWRTGARLRVDRPQAQAWLAIDGFARTYDQLPLSLGLDAAVEARWVRGLGVRLSGRYAWAITGEPEAGRAAERAHVARLGAEAYGLLTGRRWLVRPSLLYRTNLAGDGASTNADPTLWNNYFADLPTWYEGAALLQWAPSLDSRLAITPRARLASDGHLESLSSRLRVTALMAQRPWGGVYFAGAWHPTYWQRHTDIALRRQNPFFAHETSLGFDFLRQWQHRWWFKLGLRGSLQYVKGARNAAGWVQFEFTRSRRRSLDDMLPSEQEFDQLTSGRSWADETY